MIVMKFGGSSVKDANAVDRVFNIIFSKVKLSPVVVVSATGDTTDKLENILSKLENDQQGAKEFSKQILKSHNKLIEETVLEKKDQAFAKEKILIEVNRLNNLISGMECLGEVSLRSRDAVLSVGEKMSAPLLVACLSSRGIKAVYVDPCDIIVTDDNFGCAVPNCKLTLSKSYSVLSAIIDKGMIPVIGGFAGATKNGVITTLGRGGSDLTASLLAKVLQAKSLEYWKDVDGILTADPRIVKDAKPVYEMTFREAAELAFLGAGVLHPASIQPAVDAGIPVRVLNSFRQQSTGTTIRKIRPAGMKLNADKRTNPSKRAVTSIAYKRDQVMINVFSSRMLGSSGFLRKVFEVFDSLKVSVDHIATSEVNVTVTTQQTDQIELLKTELAEVAQVDVMRSVGIVSIVGEALSSTPGVSAKVFTALKDINVLLITHGGAAVNLSFVVTNNDVANTVRVLHKEFFSDGD